MTTDERPVLVIDVNETRSGMRPLHHAFEELGVPGSWLRRGSPFVVPEGFALAAHGEP